MCGEKCVGVEYETVGAGVAPGTGGAAALTHGAPVRAGDWEQWEATQPAHDARPAAGAQAAPCTAWRLQPSH